MQIASYESLTAHKDLLWRDLMSTSSFAAGVRESTVDRRLFALFLIETYHYTLHNPKHQALVGTRGDVPSEKYRRFCFHHAEEETGHELMALHDLETLGPVDRKAVEVSSPLFETEALIAYLYHISTTGNPLRRLGYSFWAEDAYRYIGPLIQKAKADLELADSQMTFLISHANIDLDHAREVRETMAHSCRTAQDWGAIAAVMEGSLRLQWSMLNAIWREFQQMQHGTSSRTELLDGLN